MHVFQSNFFNIQIQLSDQILELQMFCYSRATLIYFLKNGAHARMYTIKRL